jgi:O-antigen ligase
VRTPRELRTLLSVVAIFGLVYGVLILYEARMSPQLHMIFYGLHPNKFSKVFRLGGYRPMVFMQSGLAVAIFVWTCAMAGFGIARAGLPVMKLPGVVVASGLAFVLVLCRSLGALMYGMVSLPLLALTPRRMAPAAVLGIAALVGAYPALRVLDLVPIHSIHAYASSLNQDRADSLLFRFENESQVVDRTLQKPLFGWGGHDRSRVRVDNQEEVRATDGFWVIVLGQRGIVGLGLVLTLLVWPLLRAGRRLRRVRDARAHALLLALALIVGIRAFDMMPNGLYGTLPFYLAGALYGVTEWTAPRRRAVAPPAPDRASGPQSAR